MLVVITISCFFVAMVYASVRFFLMTYSRDKETQQVANALWTLEGSLLHVTNASKYIYGFQADSLLLFIMPGGDTIIYHFHYRYILRTQKHRNDSIVAGCSDLHFSNNGHLVENGIIDHLEIKTGYRQTSQIIQHDKTYTPEMLFNLKETFNKTFP